MGQPGNFPQGQLSGIYRRATISVEEVTVIQMMSNFACTICGYLVCGQEAAVPYFLADPC